MNKEQIKEAILGQEGCKKEDTPLTLYSTFEPDMEMVELLLKGADLDKSFNECPLGWILQFCLPNLEKMLELLFKYKYSALHLARIKDFEYLLQILDIVKKETARNIIKTMRTHSFNLTHIEYNLLKSEKFKKVQPSIDSLHNLIKNIGNLNDGYNKLRYLDDLYKEGQNLLTKRLLKYI